MATWLVPRTIEFSGYTWSVKGGPQLMGPGPNRWSDAPESVWVGEDGALHLKIRQEGDHWVCSEVYLSRSLGYGEYRFDVRSPSAAVPPNAVLGLFTWSNTDEEAHREIDVEVTRWGDRNAANGQFVVQPYDKPGHMVRFEIDESQGNVMHRFTWKPDRVDFLTRLASGRHVSEWTFPGPIFAPKDEAVHINLWLYEGKPPSTGKDVEVIIEKFTFTPHR